MTMCNFSLIHNKSPLAATVLPTLTLHRLCWWGECGHTLERDCSYLYLVRDNVGVPKTCQDEHFLSCCFSLLLLALK